MTKMTFTTKRAIAVLDQIVTILKETAEEHPDGLSVQMVADRIGITKRWTAEYLNHLHDYKRVHLAPWLPRSDGLGYTLAYWPGPGEDAKKPRGMTDVEKVQTYRQKLYADPIRHAAWLKRERTKKKKKTAVRRLARKKEQEFRAQQLQAIESTIRQVSGNPFDALFRMAA